MTGKPRYFAPKYGTSHFLYQTDFGILLKNAVPNILALRCISVDYTRFCEGCESKKCKNVGCARTRTRERGGKDENLVHSKWFSEVRFILLQAPNKNIGRFPKNVGHFPKNVGSFSKNVGSFSAYLPRFFLYSPMYYPFHKRDFSSHNYIFYSWYLALSSYTHKSAHKRKCKGGMWRQNRWRNHSPP